MDLLTVVAKMVPDSTDDILQKIHSARDKHIFRILAVVADPRHGKSIRARALDEMPKRTKALGDNVKDWVMTLIKRCLMGDFLNAENIQQCVKLAHAYLANKDIPSTLGFLSCVKLAVEIFPTICSETESFQTLQALFSLCRGYLSGSGNKELKKQIEGSGMVTSLCSILTVVARDAKVVREIEGVSTSCFYSGSSSIVFGVFCVSSLHHSLFQPDADPRRNELLKKELLQLCTKDGTPQQARDAIGTLTSLFGLEDPSEDSEAVSTILKALTVPSKMNVNSETFQSDQVVSMLAALAALVERAPRAVRGSPRGENAVRFAFDILLGRSRGSHGSGTSDDEEDATPARRRKSNAKKNHRSPDGERSLLENTDLSLPCRRLCAATEFLVSCARSSKGTALDDLGDDNNDECLLSAERVKSLFGVLIQIVRDHGVPRKSEKVVFFFIVFIRVHYY